MRKSGKRIVVILAVLLVIGFGLAGGQPSAGAEGQNGTTLTAEVAASGSLTRTFGWTIDKTATPAVWNLFQGDSGTSQYTVSVAKDGGADAASFSGSVYVYNGGEVATDGLAIAIALSLPPDQTVLATANVDTSVHPILAPYTGYSYTYQVTVPAADIIPGGNYKVTANVSITNHSGSLGTPKGPSPSDTDTLPASPTLVNDSVNVDDTYGHSWQFNASGSQTYGKTFTSAQTGSNANTATIRETGQTASASVSVSSYSLTVTTSAATSLTRTYSWTIQKTADQSSLTLAVSQQFPVNYLVTIDGRYADSNWAAAGTISVANPAPIAATVNSVAGAISSGIAAAVDCGTTFPAVIAAGQTLSCTYTVALPDASSRTSTATAVLQNSNYDYQLTATAAGTTPFSVSSPLSFASAAKTEIDKCISVTDNLQGSMGNVCYDTTVLPKSFSYSRSVGPYSSSGSYAVSNTASYASSATSTTGSSTWVVTVNVPGSGCTLTIGYWKTHAGAGPQRDMVTPLLPQWLGINGGAKSILVPTAASAIDVLAMKAYGTASNGITKLYAQLLGAKLNIADGASATAVSGTIAAADSFLATKNWQDWSKLSKAQQGSVLGWMKALDSYNNGLTGPGHCSQ